LGGFLQFYVQWWQVKKEGFRILDFKAELKDPLKAEGVKQVLFLLIPGTVGLAATQLGILINSIYATSAGAGAVSWLNYASRLMQFPLGIFGVSLAVATLPAFSRKLAEGNPQGASSELLSSLKMCFCVNGPASAGLMVVGLPIIQLLFQHGAFKEFDALQTSQAVFWYALSLPGYSVVKILVPIFYALGNTRVPVGFSFLAVGLNAALNHLLLEVWHYPFWSLAAATSASSTLNASFLLLILTYKLPGFRLWPVFCSFFVHALVSCVVGGAAYAALKITEGYGGGVLATGSHFLFWSVEVLFALGLATVAWLVVGTLFRIPENSKVMQFLLKKFKRAG
jgi:putative peptidoglycan lipid II flippase